MKQEISLKKIFGGSQILTINATKFAGLDEGATPLGPYSAREDLHGSSTTDMPIVGRLKMSDKQTILTQFTRKKTLIFSLIFSDLKRGFFIRT